MAEIKDIWTELRKPFDPKAVGKLPRGGIQLDYVGHAAVTDRLNTVDPTWTWEPMATDSYGVPYLVDTADGFGKQLKGLWIRITINGVTRPAFGDGKTEKEAIGDAIRNGAMRFGVALDLWSKDELESNIGHPENKNIKPTEKPDVPFDDDPITPQFITMPTAKKLAETLKVKGFTEKADRDTILNRMSLANFQVPALMRLSEAQGTELYAKIVATKKEDLDMLVSME